MSKTMKISALIEKTNAMMADSADSARMERIAIHHFVSDILMEAKVYSGFGYVKPYGSLGSDDSRTFFYIHHKLQ